MLKKHTWEAYLEPSQASKIELFQEIANGFKPFIIFAKNSILDIWLSSEYTSVSIEKYYPIERDGGINCASIFDIITTVKYNTHFGKWAFYGFVLRWEGAFWLELT